MYWVLDAGHVVPTDVPDTALRMVTGILDNVDYRSDIVLIFPFFIVMYFLVFSTFISFGVLQNEAFLRYTFACKCSIL